MPCAIAEFGDGREENAAVCVVAVDFCAFMMYNRKEYKLGARAARRKGKE